MVTGLRKERAGAVPSFMMSFKVGGRFRVFSGVGVEKR
jgi:hypothetical protein